MTPWQNALRNLMKAPAPLVPSRTCSECFTTKPESDFHVCGQRKDGSIRYRGACKECICSAKRKKGVPSVFPTKGVILCSSK